MWVKTQTVTLSVLCSTAVVVAGAAGGAAGGGGSGLGQEVRPPPHLVHVGCATNQRPLIGAKTKDKRHKTKVESSPPTPFVFRLLPFVFCLLFETSSYRGSA